MSRMPAGAPPGGMMPPSQNPGIEQVGDYTGLQNTLFGIITTFLALAIAAVALRFWSRSIKGMRFAVNDFFAVAALITLLPFFAIMVYGLCTGMGRHIRELRDPSSQVPHLLKLMIPLQVLWSTINTLVKISMIDLYLRVFPNKHLRLAAYVLLCCVCIYWVVAFIFNFVACRPFSYNWDKSIRDGHCMNPQSNTLGLGITNLILDIAIIVLPLPYLYTLQLKLAKRLSLITIFAIGFVITAISAVRVSRIVLAWKNDFPIAAAQIALWSFLETSLSVINCCLPTIQPAVIAVFRSTSYIFSHVTLSSHRPTEKEETLPTHKFITLPLDSAAYYTRSNSPSPPPTSHPEHQLSSSSRQQPDSSQAIPLQHTPRPKDHWTSENNSRYGQSGDAKEVEVAVHSHQPGKSNKSLPPLPPDKGQIQVLRGSPVSFGNDRGEWQRGGYISGSKGGD